MAVSNHCHHSFKIGVPGRLVEAATRMEMRCEITATPRYESRKKRQQSGAENSASRWLATENLRNFHQCGHENEDPGSRQARRSRQRRLLI
jgi:hypothetical protein